jgi:uncharacterized membrane protein YoaK (UPF0700 family)
MLTGAAGYVDAISYLALGRVFTANMTGNTVLFGLALVHGEIASIVNTLVALAGFLVGGAIGARIAYRGPRDDGWPRGVTIALGVECVLLAVLANERTSAGAFAVLLAALAMGIQSAAARRLDVLGVATTFLTGTLTSLVSLIARHGVLPSASGHGKRFLAGVWSVYVAGAMAAGLLNRHLPDHDLLVPPALVATVVVLAAARFWRA